MKILIGKVIKWGHRSAVSVEITGLGRLVSQYDDRGEPFPYIELSKKQLVKLRKQIDKELKIDG